MLLKVSGKVPGRAGAAFLLLLLLLLHCQAQIPLHRSNSLSYTPVTPKDGILLTREQCMSGFWEGSDGTSCLS